ncbi:MAG: sigma 54-interacting transcriptional regulator [Bacillota bacterium]|nr:sigma 54-interacting transcriptional regulator [Bacillota bacterium]
MEVVLIETNINNENRDIDSGNITKRYNEIRSALENSFDGVMITNSKGIGLKVNPALVRLTGLEENHFVGKEITQLTEKGIFVYEPITIRALREKRIVTGVQEINNGRAVTVTGVPVLDAEKKKVIRIITNVRDLIELNQLKEDMRKSQELLLRYETELAALRFELMKSQQIVAQSEQMLGAMETAFHIAGTEANVLILGESGVGKDIIARLIHNHSSRDQQGCFIKVNCGAIPSELMESEFFGYDRGAFTGARREGKRGFFELAHEGTLFLDEIADLPLKLQVKLLRVLEDRELIRLGGEKAIKVNARIITATNKDLDAMVADGSFREDLFYRLNVVPITVPPLRERPEDISALLAEYLARFNEKYKVYKSFSRETLQLLFSYHWPGNVRELINLVERLVITTRCHVILPEHLPECIIASINDCLPLSVHLLEHDYLRSQLRSKSMKEILDEVEKKILLTAYSEFRSSRKVGEILGISHATVINKLRKHGIIH